MILMSTPLSKSPENNNILNFIKVVLSKLGHSELAPWEVINQSIFTVTTVGN